VLLLLLLLPAVLFNGTTENKAAWVALRWALAGISMVEFSMGFVGGVHDGVQGEVLVQ
jgi:hypothetical protein